VFEPNSVEKRLLIAINENMQLIEQETNDKNPAQSVAIATLACLQKLS
jgi:hypothetical protein